MRPATIVLLLAGPACATGAAPQGGGRTTTFTTASSHTGGMGTGGSGSADAGGSEGGGTYGSGGEDGSTGSTGPDGSTGAADGSSGTTGPGPTTDAAGTTTGADPTAGGTTGAGGGQPAAGMYSHCDAVTPCTPAGFACVAIEDMQTQTVIDGFCSQSPCTNPATDCDPSPGGTAVPACADGYCYLDCSGGKTCPAGMVCYEILNLEISTCA